MTVVEKPGLFVILSVHGEGDIGDDGFQTGAIPLTPAVLADWSEKAVLADRLREEHGTLYIAFSDETPEFRRSSGAYVDDVELPDWAAPESTFDGCVLEVGDYAFEWIIIRDDVELSMTLTRFEVREILAKFLGREEIA